MTAPPLTPSPYLRDHLLTAARNLRRDAETARLNLAEAEQDVAAARELLAEAEAQERRARAEADGLARDIAWAEEQAAARTAEIDAATAAHHAGIVRDEPDALTAGGEVPYTDVPDTDLPGMWEEADFSGGWADTDSVPPVKVARSRDEVGAALAGTPHVPPPVPDGPAGEVVATHGPTVTMPDLGPTPPPLNPPPGHGVHTHAKPADGLMSRLTGGWPVVGRKRTDEQDGDADA